MSRSAQPKESAASPLLLPVVCLGQFLVVFSLSSVNVALPSLAADLQMSRETQPYTVTAYGIALGSLLLLGGRAGDLLGRRRLFRLGTGVFAVGTVVCTLANVTGVLLAGRALEGLGAAMLAPAALGTINAIYPQGPSRNKALGVFGAVSSAAAGVGVLAGGVLTDGPGWRWAFAIKIPFCLLLLAVVGRIMPETRDTRSHHGFDIAGALTATGSMFSLVVAITQAEQRGFTSPAILALFGSAAVLLIAFIVIESRSDDPLMPLALFRRRGLSVANGATLLVWASFGSAFLLVALYVQQVLGYSPMKAGLTFVPMATAAALAANVAQATASRSARGPKPALLVGLVLLTVGVALLSRGDADTRYTAVLLPALVLCGAGLATSLTALNVAAFSGSNSDDSGVEAGLLSTSQEIGAALGVSILSTVSARVISDHLAAHPGDPTAMLSGTVDAFQVSFVVAAGMAAGAFLLSLIALSTRVDIPPASVSENPLAEPASIMPSR
ncbi:hypothetical protein ThrDRAFT_02490 [Frankia casuarinae]|uniref:Major facilitator superfamily MFS_1 n=2 Tax=Frankia casuarinae (strain DSM 45818 / CECT 9043 / HFP020203 / CcI3) TaxID=106370 RepID=Q2J9D0_FRACC|nr:MULTISPECIES: MFS transporter [Frankia]ABD12112.1 major facilitator superfamily MFS_1 [Frankia casuarinae]ETA00530.1 hypothetical protein CcI6DRAFT_04054 [Frankia sp. CcI6]EYT91845.1 hypothetical protein ThrDRAFT_02490 [Frankia casuarinae]KDA41014.1 hypothetical protein BMG523Draft_04171 [Frankia sp. BMG5.23]KEZ34837.1 Major Facilitator Superfamily transporter [Frankia sp. CeD]